MSDTIDPKYLKGFNHGYLLAEHRPKLTNDIVQSKNDGQYFDGFENGASLYQQRNQVISRSDELKILKEKNRGEKDQER